MKKISIFLALLLFTGLLGAQTLYKSTGPNGEVIYSAKPPADAHVEKTLTYTPGPSSPLPDYVLRYMAEMEKKMSKKAAKGVGNSQEVQLFTASWCGFCRRAKAYLAKKQIAYTEYDVETPAGMEALVQVGEKGQGVPVLVWQDEKVHGFSEPTYDALFSGRR